MSVSESGRPRERVLVTGANSGIGLATAVELARRGFDTFGSVRSDEKAATVAEAAAEAGVEIETTLLDVTDAARCEAVIEQVRPWGLVNNAGYGLTGAIEDVDDDEAHQLFETMVFGPLRLARLAIPSMRDGGGGRIVNVSSIYGRTTTPLTGWYQGAKHALEALSDALRMEVAGDGVRVVLVEPGGFNTNIWEDLDRDVAARAGSRYAQAYERTAQMMRLTSPLMGEPRQCARVIAGALTSPVPRSRYLVGIDANLMAAAARVTPRSLLDRASRLALGL